MDVLTEKIKATHVNELVESAFFINDSIKGLYRNVSNLSRESLHDLIDIDPNIVALVITFGKMNNIARADEIKEIMVDWLAIPGQDKINIDLPNQFDNGEEDLNGDFAEPVLVKKDYK